MRGITFQADLIPKILDRSKTATRRTSGLEFVNQDPDAFEFVRMEGDLAIFVSGLQMIVALYSQNIRQIELNIQVSKHFIISSAPMVKQALNST